MQTHSCKTRSTRSTEPFHWFFNYTYALYKVFRGFRPSELWGSFFHWGLFQTAKSAADLHFIKDVFDQAQTSRRQTCPSLTLISIFHTGSGHQSTLHPGFSNLGWWGKICAMFIFPSTEILIYHQSISSRFPLSFPTGWKVAPLYGPTGFVFFYERGSA